MWRRMGVMLAILVIGAGATTVAHGDDGTSPPTGPPAIEAESSTTTALSTEPVSSATTLPPWPAAVAGPAGPDYVPAVTGTSVQLTPTLPAPTTTLPPTTTAAGQNVDVPANSGDGMRVIYAKRAQRVWLINADNTVLSTYRVSGRLDQPNPGTYHVWSRSTYTCASHNSRTCMRWMVRFAHGPEGDNIGFHEIPRENGVPLETDAQLGTPLSHGCVRQSTADAQTMWAFAGVGTTVVVVA
jgi:lipoprotein-anchoring transpeptidase ErfK/SrfK